MVLQALNRYYEILAADPKSGIALSGYCIANVSFALNLSESGELLEIFPLSRTVTRGKKEIELPQLLTVPEKIKRAGKNPPANFLCDNSVYILGISDKNSDDLQSSFKRFTSFHDFNKKILAGLNCPEARAVVAFLDSYDPTTGKSHPAIAGHLQDLLKGGNLVFRLDGKNGYIHEVSEIRAAWAAYKSKAANTTTGQCLVTGEIQPIARLHPSIKGLGSNDTTLVGFNARAYESYNRVKEQGLNSPVSEAAAFAYTTALNRLLSPDNKNGKFNMGDTTVVYWAESPDRIYSTLFYSLCNPEIGTEPNTEEGKDFVRDKRAEALIHQVAKKVRLGEALDIAALKREIDIDTRFYVLGLATNKTRISVRFFHSDPFLKIVEKIKAHYDDLSIEKEYEDQPTMIPLRQILRETASQKATNKNASPLMSGAVMRSILNGTPYPAALFYSVITRVRADVDDSKLKISKINYRRAAIIKAYLVRKYRNIPNSQIQEVLCMSLNEQSTNQAYLLGRLFAVLEKAQQDAAAPAKLNATIKDRYFTGACAAPASVFPVLLRLSQHYISKAEYGYISDRRIEEILGLLEIEKNPYPSHLALDEQGLFILGYYHQRPALYRSRSNEKNDAVISKDSSNNQ